MAKNHNKRYADEDNGGDEDDDDCEVEEYAKNEGEKKIEFKDGKKVTSSLSN